MRYLMEQCFVYMKDRGINTSTFTSRKTIFCANFASTWTRHFKHSCQLGCVISNIHVALDHFRVTLDISCHFGQCCKRPCFLLVISINML